MNVSITAEIMTDILATLDHVGVFNWQEGATPFLLIDGHRSRLDMEFLEYFCNPTHEWAVVMGVPYGTALWKVGDIPEQNGSNNMASVEIKSNIVMDKEKYMCDRPTIEPHKIISIINYAWSKSFGKVKSNKKAISDRGWYPYNRNLMIDPSVRTSIKNRKRRTKC